MFDPIEKLKEFIRHPSVSADPKYGVGMTGSREFVAGLLREMGFAVEVVPTGLHPIVLGRRGGDPSWPQVIIYGHYDVQPADPTNLWTTPPFEPTIRDGRIYGRGAADNKGPLMVHLAAVAALLEKNPQLPLRITFLVEGEEETGSPSFPAFLRKYQSELRQADLVYFSDTGIPREDQMVITTGLRGIAALGFEVTGPKMDLHSGLHGGALRNPIQAVAEICASLHTPDGRVNVPGFYDGVRATEAWEREELRKLGGDEKAYAAFLGIEAFHAPPGFSPFEATRFQPTLEFNGIGGGYQGAGSKTVIPSKAFVKISCRLVPDQDPARVAQLVTDAIRARAPRDVRIEFTPAHIAEAYIVVPPGRSNTPSNQPKVLAAAFRAADKAITETWGRPPLYLREGGSVPIIAQIKQVLGLDSLMLGLALPEDNLHAPDESFKLSILEKGIATSQRILEGIAANGR